jgi:phosphocarrier protein HPr
MIERTATIASNVGLHARPASIIAEAASAYEDLEITIGSENEPAEDALDASSVLSLMSLGAGHGDTVVLRTQGAGAEKALNHLVELLETDLDAK